MQRTARYLFHAEDRVDPNDSDTSNESDDSDISDDLGDSDGQLDHVGNRRLYARSLPPSTYSVSTLPTVLCPSLSSSLPLSVPPFLCPCLSPSLPFSLPPSPSPGLPALNSNPSSLLHALPTPILSPASPYSPSSLSPPSLSLHPLSSPPLAPSSFPFPRSLPASTHPSISLVFPLSFLARSRAAHIPPPPHLLPSLDPPRPQLRPSRARPGLSSKSARASARRERSAPPALPASMQVLDTACESCALSRGPVRGGVRWCARGGKGTDIGLAPIQAAAPLSFRSACTLSAVIGWARGCVGGSTALDCQGTSRKHSRADGEGLVASNANPGFP